MGAREIGRLNLLTLVDPLTNPASQRERSHTDSPAPAIALTEVCALCLVGTAMSQAVAQRIAQGLPGRRSGSQSQRRYRSCGRTERSCSRHPSSQSTIDSNQQQQLRWSQLKRRARVGGSDRARLQPRGGRQAPGIV
jgi:hypothetical protein